MQGDKAISTELLKETTEEQGIAPKPEKHACRACYAGHKRTQAKLRGRLFELREARRKASQRRAGLRVSVARNGDFVDRLADFAGDRDTTVARVAKAEAQSSAGKGKEADVFILSGRLAISKTSLEAVEDELAVNGSR